MIVLTQGSYLQARLAALPTGGIKSVTIANGGSGYSASPQTLTLVQAGAALGTVTCTVAGGIVTAITAISAEGTGYSVANTLATTGGGGTNCTINITAIYQPSYICNYIDSDDVPGATSGFLNGTTATTILSAPATGQRMLDLAIIFNADKATVNPIVEVVSGGNTVEIVPRQSITINQTLQFGRQTEGSLTVDDYLLIADIDDTPANGVVNAPISSNWAYDHAISTSAHSDATTFFSGFQSAADKTKEDTLINALLSTITINGNTSISGTHSGVNTGDNAANTSIAATKLDDFSTPDNNTDLNANTTNHGLLLQATAPASGYVNLVGITYGETNYYNKALFDSTVPSTQAFSDTATTGTATVAARRDHKHEMPATPVNISGSSATVTTNANLTGVITSVGNATSVATQSGTGSIFVMRASPTLDTPTIGNATATSINKISLTSVTTAATLTILDGKTLTVNKSVTFAGTDGYTINFAGSGTYSGTSSGSNTGDQVNISGNSATVTTNANLTGVITSVGNTTSVATQSGTGSIFVMRASPTLDTPTLGNATATSINKISLTAVSTSATFALANAKTLTVNKSVTFAGTDGYTINWAGSGTYSGTSSGSNTGDQVNISGNSATVTTNANLTGVITSSGNTTSAATQTGTGSMFVMKTSPTLTTPNIGVATATTINKISLTGVTTAATISMSDCTLTISADTTISGAATSGTINTGTNTTAFLNSDALAGSNLGTKTIPIKVVPDFTTCTLTLSSFLVPASMNGMNIISGVASCGAESVGVGGVMDFAVVRARPTRIGSSTTQFDITNPSGTTFRYTWDGTGTNPNITSGFFDSAISINAQNFAAGNKLYAYVTAADTNWFEIDNASGTAESNKTIGTGFIEVSLAGLVFSAKPTIDSMCANSLTSTVTAIVDTNYDDLATGDLIVVYVANVHSTTAAQGANIVLEARLP
jgi:hypothetical protein